MISLTPTICTDGELTGDTMIIGIDGEMDFAGEDTRDTFIPIIEPNHYTNTVNLLIEQFKKESV